MWPQRAAKCSAVSPQLFGQSTSTPVLSSPHKSTSSPIFAALRSFRPGIVDACAVARKARLAFKSCLWKIGVVAEKRVMTMKVGITGALSYSGRYLAQRLLRQGHEVVNLSRRSTPIAVITAV